MASRTNRLRFVEAALASVADGVIIVDAEGYRVFVNDAARTLTQMVPSLESPVENQAVDVKMRRVDGSPLSPGETPLGQALRGNTVTDLPVIIGRPDGTDVYVSATASPVPDEQGKITGAVVILRDITERKLAEEERERWLEGAEEERNRLRALIETAPVGIVFYSAPDGHAELFNKAAEEVLGQLPPPGATATEQAAFYTVSLPDGSPFPNEQLPLVRSLRGEVCVGVEMLIYQPSGSKLYLLVNSSPLRDPKGNITGAVLVFQDITGIKEQEQLRDEFISAAAHELRTPVTTIKGYAQLMRLWAPEGHEPREAAALAVIDSQCNRINRRVQEMLEAARFRTVPPELHYVRFDLQDLATQVVERMKAVTQTHRLVLKREGPVPVEADRERIEEVLVSLVDNAIKFSPQGGEITVRVWPRAGEGLVSVKDYGMGIAKERQPHVFEPFYEYVPYGTPGYRGTVTLSLYLAKLTVERHKGRIWFESESGKGSTFTFALPLA